MIIPESAKQKISQVFYDKTFQIYTVVDTVDEEGWAAKSGSTVISGTFKGNINFDALDRIQEDYGLKEDIDATITTATSVPLYSIIGYLGRQFKVIRVLPFDSHYFLIVQEWLSKSSTSISA